MNDYKKEIVNMVEKLEDDLFIIQIYTIILYHVRKRGN